MSRAPVITTLEPRVSHADNRGDGQHHYGFIYFASDVASTNFDGQEVRMGYMGGTFSPAKEADAKLHEVERYCPYVFTGNWGEPAYAHVIQAWDWAVRNHLEGFAEYAAEHPDSIRWMNGGEFILADRITLEMVAVRERQSALRSRRALRSR